MRAAPLTLSALLLLLATGVARAGSPPEAALERFVRSHGGRAGGVAQARADRVLEPLRSLPGLGHLTVSVLASPTFEAFAWPSGALLVTTGLLERVDDGELAAALAHEAAHLLLHQSPGTTALAGKDGDGDLESRADALGCRLLGAQGHPESDLRRLLIHMENPILAGPLGVPAMSRRVRALEPGCLAQG